MAPRRILCCLFFPTDTPDFERCCEDALAILDELEQPVESTEPGVAFVDITAILPLFTGEQELIAPLVARLTQATGLHLRWCLAGTRFASRLLAGRLQRSPAYQGLTLCPGTERQVLSPIPIADVALGPELRRRLSLLGIRTLGQFADLPTTAILTQFGRAGQQLYRQIRAQEDVPLIARRREPTLSRVQELDFPLEDSLLLWRHLEHLIGSLYQELQRRSLSAGRLTVRLLMCQRWQDYTLVPSAPLGLLSGLLSSSRELLASAAPAQAVYGLGIEAGRLQPLTMEQLALFSQEKQESERLQQVLGHLRAKYRGTRFVRARSNRPNSLQATARFQMIPAGQAP